MPNSEQSATSQTISRRELSELVRSQLQALLEQDNFRGAKALLVPANRFEVVECHAALEAVKAHTLDGDPAGPGPRDVLCQHILIRACAGPFDADALFAEVRTVGAYRALPRASAS